MLKVGPTADSLDAQAMAGYIFTQKLFFSSGFDTSVTTLHFL